MKQSCTTSSTLLPLATTPTRSRSSCSTPPSTHLAWYLPAAVALGAVVVLVLRRVPDPQRRFLHAILGAVALATVGLVFYAARGIEDLTAPYLGFFYLAAPALFLLVLAAGALARTSRRWVHAVVAVAAVVGGVAAVQGSDWADLYIGRPELPSVVSTLAERRTSTSQSLVLELDGATWPDAVGVIVHANRSGIPACIGDDFWSFMVTDEFICTRSERERGKWFRLNRRRTTKNAVATLAGAEVTEVYGRSPRTPEAQTGRG